MSEAPGSHLDDQIETNYAAVTDVLEANESSDGAAAADPEGIFPVELIGKHVQEEPTHGRWQCHHCNNSYSDKRGLKRHLETLEGKLYQCEICLKMFSRNDVYKRHLRLVHGPYYYAPQGDDLQSDANVRGAVSCKYMLF